MKKIEIRQGSDRGREKNRSKQNYSHLVVASCFTWSLIVAGVLIDVAVEKRSYLPNAVVMPSHFVCGQPAAEAPAIAFIMTCIVNNDNMLVPPNYTASERKGGCRRPGENVFWPAERFLQNVKVGSRLPYSKCALGRIKRTYDNNLQVDLSTERENMEPQCLWREWSANPSKPSGPQR
jgi:hypothetical protein